MDSSVNVNAFDTEYDNEYDGMRMNEQRNERTGNEQRRRAFPCWCWAAGSENWDTAKCYRL